MTEEELAQYNKLIQNLFSHNFDLKAKFGQLKVRIDGRNVVMYSKVKKYVLREMMKAGKIDTKHIPFLNYSQVLRKKIGF